MWASHLLAGRLKSFQLVAAAHLVWRFRQFFPWLLHGLHHMLLPSTWGSTFFLIVGRGSAAYILRWYSSYRCSLTAWRIPSLEPLRVEFACSLCARVGSLEVLWLPPTVEEQACEVNCKP